jgi:DNA-binding beta-propeller fold protein YncE
MAVTQLRYEVIPDWEHLPSEFTHLDVVGVAVDSHDRVFIYTRDDARVVVYEQDGRYVTSWGDGFFTARTHGLTIGPDDQVYCVDEGNQVVYRFSPDGKLQQTIGTLGVASNTGYDGRSLDSIRPGAGPFNRPTNLAVAPSGDLYVSDGYGNARVHRFSAAGKLIQSWGEPGTGPGQFNLPHGIFVLPDGRVLVADRENDRIQFFSPDGQFLSAWTDVQRPTNVYVDRNGIVYVSELWRPVGHRSYTLGVTAEDRPGRVSIYDLDGRALARWGSTDRCAPGNFCAPHDICADSRGDVYVAEVTHTFGVKPGLVPADCHTFQKFARRA